MVVVVLVLVVVAVIMAMAVMLELVVEVILVVVVLHTLTKTCPGAALPTTNPIFPGLKSNLGLHVESDQLCQPGHSFIVPLFVNQSISPADVGL